MAVSRFMRSCRERSADDFVAVCRHQPNTQLAQQTGTELLETLRNRMHLQSLHLLVVRVRIRASQPPKRRLRRVRPSHWLILHRLIVMHRQAPTTGHIT
jgi:hypothetical protein